MTGECCYWYTHFPATATCDRNTDSVSTTLTLACGIEYWLSDSTIDVEVKWYRSRSEQTAGIEGETLFPLELKKDMNFINTELKISNFNDNDRGYYWCQIVANNVSLPPSPIGYINSSHCTVAEVTCDRKLQPLCAQLLIQRLMARKQRNEIGCSLDTVTDSRITTTSDLVTDSDNNRHFQYLVGISVGTIVLITISLFVLTGLLLFFCKKRKAGITI